MRKFAYKLFKIQSINVVNKLLAIPNFLLLASKTYLASNFCPKKHKTKKS